MIPAPTVEIWRKNRWQFAGRVWFLAMYFWISAELFLRDDIWAALKAIGVWFCGSVLLLLMGLLQIWWAQHKKENPPQPPRERD